MAVLRLMASRGGGLFDGNVPCPFRTLTSWRANWRESRSTAAGIKGMAEGGVMGALGAVTNALNDALAPFYVVAEQHPLTPMYVRDLLRDAL